MNAQISQYMETRVPNPLPIGGTWCEIYKAHGHDPYHFTLMHKSVGHDDKYCRTMDLMMKRTLDTYRVHA
jgi:hypothetical protein